MENKIDLSKTYKTRDGREVRLFTTESPVPHYPIMGSYLDDARELDWRTGMWSKEGLFNSRTLKDSALDLIEVKEKIKLTGFLNVYKSGRHQAHKDEMDANCNASPDRIACIDLSQYNIEYDGFE